MAGHYTGTDNPVPALFCSLKEQLEQPDEIQNLLSGVGEAQSRVQTPDGLTMVTIQGLFRKAFRTVNHEPSLPL